MEVHIKKIEKSSDFFDLKNEWSEFFEKTKSKNPFLTFEWMYTWWESFKDNKSRLNILLFYKKKELIGIVPLFYKKKLGLFREFFFIGTGRSDLLNILYAEKDFELVFDYFISYLRKTLKGFDIIDLQDLCLNLNEIKYLMKKCRNLKLNPIYRVQDCCPIIKTGNLTWTNYLEKKNIKKKIIQEERRLKKKGDVHVETIKSFNISKSFDTNIFQVASDIERKSWKFVNGSERINTSKKSRMFFKNMLQRFSSKGMVEFRVYCLDKLPRAYSILFNLGKKTFYYNTAFDNALLPLGPGALLLINNVRESFNNGFEEFNFLRGHEDYKNKWTTETQSLYELVITKSQMHPKQVYYKTRWFSARIPFIITAAGKFRGTIQKLKRKK